MDKPQWLFHLKIIEQRGSAVKNDALRLAVKSPQPDRPYLMRIREARRLTGLGVQTIRDWVKRGAMPRSSKSSNGTTTAWNSADIFAWIDTILAKGSAAIAP